MTQGKHIRTHPSTSLGHVSVDTRGRNRSRDSKHAINNLPVPKVRQSSHELLPTSDLDERLGAVVSPKMDAKIFARAARGRPAQCSRIQEPPTAESLCWLPVSAMGDNFPTLRRLCGLRPPIADVMDL